MVLKKMQPVNAVSIVTLHILFKNLRLSNAFSLEQLGHTRVFSHFPYDGLHELGLGYRTGAPAAVISRDNWRSTGSVRDYHRSYCILMTNDGIRRFH